MLLPAPVVVALAAVPAAPAEPPLHERIDRRVAAGLPDYDRLAAPLARDAG